MNLQLISIKRKMFSLIAVGVFLFALPFAFVACSSDDDGGDSTNTSTNADSGTNGTGNNGSGDSGNTENNDNSGNNNGNNTNTSSVMFMGFENVINFSNGATTDEITPKILALTGDTTLKFNGAINAVTLKAIAAAMQENDSVQIALDFSDTTGITEWKDWFAGVDTLYAISLPNTVTTVQSGVFADCSKLKAVTIPSTIQVFNSEQAEYVNFAGSISDWLNNSIVISSWRTLYFNGVELTEAVIPSTVTAIKEYAFIGFKKLASVTIPSSVTTIANGAFNGCSTLKEVVIADGDTTLTLGYNKYDSLGGKGLFYDCPLEKLYLGRNLAYSLYTEYNSGYSYEREYEIYAYNYGYSAFYKKETLNSLEIGRTVTNIGLHEFRECKGLTSVIIPNSVKDIGDYAFQNCTGLTNMMMGTGVTSIGKYAFESCDGLKSLAIGDGVINIGDHAFGYCDELSSVTIGNKVENIGECAFSGCQKLSCVMIPISVTSIGSKAFEYSSYYIWVYYYGTADQWRKIKNNSALFELTLVNNRITYNYTDE